MGPIERHEHTVRIANVEGLRGTCRVREFPDLPLDEPPEFYGSDSAPSPADYLLIAVGGCLVNSLAFCFQRRRVRALLEAETVGAIARDAEGQLRVAEIACTLSVNASPEDHATVRACYDTFKKYCVISASVGRGIPIRTDLRLASA